MRKTLALLVTVTALTLAGPAHGVTGQLGNDAIDRATHDTWDDFVAVDTNNPAAFDGTFTAINYHAERVGEIRFVLVDANDEVTWVSDVLTPGSVGANVATFPQPVGVTAGTNLGVYSQGLGVVSYDYDNTAAHARFTWYNSGVPGVGEPLSSFMVTNGARRYSMNAVLDASSPQICKDGGWAHYGYTNQGQCIASIVANENGGR